MFQQATHNPIAIVLCVHTPMQSIAYGKLQNCNFPNESSLGGPEFGRNNYVNIFSRIRSSLTVMIALLLMYFHEKGEIRIRIKITNK